MNAFAFLLSMTGLFFLFCFLPLWRHFAVCDQTTALPCCTTSHCHLECHSADGQRKQVLLTLRFLIENYLWEKGKDLALLPEGASLPHRGKQYVPRQRESHWTTRHHSKSSSFTAAAVSSRFPQGSSFSCGSLRGSGRDGCPTGAMPPCWPVP